MSIFLDDKVTNEKELWGARREPYSRRGVSSRFNPSPNHSDSFGKEVVFVTYPHTPFIASRTISFKNSPGKSFNPFMYFKVFVFLVVSPF